MTLYVMPYFRIRIGSTAVIQDRGKKEAPRDRALIAMKSRAEARASKREKVRYFEDRHKNC
jgi:hypothetical protein